VLLNAAKNGSGLSAAGISSRVEGPNIAEPAATTACPAPEASQELTVGLPHRKHALICQLEHEAWDVLLACQGQLRLAPSGHVIGIEMNAALNIGAALGVSSELLPAAEAGLVEALFSNRDQMMVLDYCQQSRMTA
jgi:hypothetical protein